MSKVELKESFFEMVNQSIKVLDVLYTSKLDFDECMQVLNVLSNSLVIKNFANMEPDKKSIKDLKDSMQKDVDEYNKKKASAATLTKQKNISRRL